MRLAPGTKVDRYVVEGLLGSGGMAEVYAVRHATLGSAAALKVLTVRSDVLQRRLVREGRAQAMLSHPNVVRVLDLVEVEGAPGLVMERVDGPTLASVLQGGPLLPDRVERLARGLLLGLGEAHRLGIVHRDLKPSNVLLAAGDVPRIADFGLATALADDPAAGLTRPGAAIGTPAYMAPEQHEDARTVDVRADLFALGVVLYELLVGRAPADGQNAIAAWHTMSRKAWRSAREVDSRVPARLDAAIRWAMEPDREDRPASVGAMWEALTGSPWGGPVAPEMPGEVVASRSQVSDDAGALPKPARALVGRSTELLAALDPLEARGSVVTLAGTGGVGKTRLALAVAERWVDGGRDALWVDLAPARHTDDLVQGVGLCLADAGDGSVAAIGRAMGRRGALLVVLDNVEQLPREIGAVLATWTGLAPSLRILVTSRQPLAVPEEIVVEINPLPLPDDVDEVLASPAWALFQAMAPRAALDQVSAARAHALLHQLEGLPLAMELAAARLEVLEIDDLESRLQDRFSILSDPDAATDRHGALWTAIAWSWSLLTESERQALSQASVFRAPFALEAAERVLAPGVPVLDALHGLIRRSLLRRRGGRFTMLGSIRDFARRQLADEDWHAVVRRHAAWHAAQAEEVTGKNPSGTIAGMRQIEPLVPELDAVVRSAAQVPGLASEALRCARGYVSLSTTRGPREAVIRVVTTALALVPDPTPFASDAAILLMLRALALRRGARFDEARADLERALTLVGDDAYGAVVTAHMGDLVSAMGDHPGAERWLRRAVALAEEHGPGHLVATVSASLAVIAHELGRTDEIPALLARARARLPAGDVAAELEVRKTEGWLALQTDDLDVAEAAFASASALAESLANGRAVAHIDGSLGIVAEVRGDLALAEARLQRAAARMAEEGDPIHFAYWEACRGRVLLRRRQWTEGNRVLGAAIARLPVTGDDDLRAVLAQALALGRARMGDTARAAADPAAEALARGFAALSRSDRDGATSAVADAERLVPVIGALETRALAVVLLEDLRDELGTWRVALDGSWAEPPGAPRIELGRHVANARIFAHLVGRRLAEPGRTSTVEDLAAAGWPGERILAQAAANRVRVALSALRRAGVTALLERAEGGWRLPPDLRIVTP